MIRPSNKEINELFELARDKSVAARTALASTISDLFIGKEKYLSDNERSLMTEVLNELIHDVELTVRGALAERLALKEGVPLELIKILANDEIEVARPILIKSPVLRDTELIEVIQYRTLEHQLAVSIREGIGEEVSAALVGTDNEDVIGSLLENHSAKISQDTMEHVTEQSKRSNKLQKPLLLRPDLSPHLARKMYWWVSAALRNHILDNFDVDPSELDDNIEATVLDAIDHLDEEHPRKSSPFRLAKQLSENDAITPRLLIQVLRRGEIVLFEALMIEYTGLSQSLVRRILFEPGGEELAIICKAKSIEKPDFASIFLLSRRARPGDKVVDPRELSRVLSFYDKISPDAAGGVMKRMARDADYLDSIRRINPNLMPGSKNSGPKS